MAFFRELTRLESLVGVQPYRIGSEIDVLTEAAGGDSAVVVTEAGQEIRMVLEADGIWRVDSLTEIVQEALSPIATSVLAVEAIVAESAYRRRSHEEIVRLLTGDTPATDP